MGFLRTLDKLPRKFHDFVWSVQDFPRNMWYFLGFCRKGGLGDGRIRVCGLLDKLPRKLHDFVWLVQDFPRNS